MSEITHSSEQYAYQDQTKPDTTTGITAKESASVEEASQAELNPAYYPAHSKPEALHNEAEKAGAEFPGTDPAAVASGEDGDGEDLDEEQEAALTDGAPGAVAVGQGAGQEPGDANSPPGSQGADGGNQAPASDEGESDEVEYVEEPSGNASRDEWVEFARASDAPEEELASKDEGGLSRDELRDKYGSAE